MVVATEELSWGALGIGGSLITRPEILTRALVAGGTEEQKRRWLPALASAEVLAAVAVTEPDFGSDVAGVTTSATRTAGRLAPQRHQDLVHLRRARRRPRCCSRAPTPTARSLTAGSRSSSSRSRRGDSEGFRFVPVTRGPRRRARAPRGTPDRHAGLSRDALLRAELRELVRPRRRPGRRRGGPRPGLLLPDGRVRERPPPDRRARHRRHAGRLRGGARVRAPPRRLRPADPGLRADSRQARRHGRDHPVVAPVRPRRSRA